MKKLFFIKDTFENKVSYFFIAGFLMALPFNHYYSEQFIVGFVAHTLIHLDKSRLPALRNKAVWIIASLFFLNMLAVLYSNYKADGFKNATQQLSILLFPVCFSLSAIDLDKYKFPLLRIFSLTCAFIIVYLYIDAFRVIHYFGLPYSSLFSGAFVNHNFSAPVGLHATYLSLYVALSISIFLFFFFRNPVIKNWKPLFFTLILLAGLVQLSSRAVFISECIILLVAVPALLLKGKKRFHFILVILLVFVLMILTIINIPSFRERYINGLETDLSEVDTTADFTETRMQRWNLELELIKKSPFIGYGTGSEKFVLKEEYFKNKFYRSYLFELNSHNQYLSFLINTGAVGLLLYLYVLCYGFLSAIKKRDFLLLSFLILIAVVSVSENLLSLSKGVLFFGFFFAFFLPDLSKKNKALPG